MLVNGIASAGTRLRSRYLVRFKPGATSHGVQRYFEGETNTGARHTAIRQDRRLVVAAENVRHRYAGIT